MVQIFYWILNNINELFVAAWNGLYEMRESIFLSLSASVSKALLHPSETLGKTLRIGLATTILGVIVGKSVENVSFLNDIKFAIVALIGLYGKEIYEYVEVKMVNPLAFWKELRGKDTKNEN